MGDQIIAAGTEAAALVPELWSSKLFQVLKNTMPLINAVNRDYEGEIQALGDTVNISTIPLFGAAENIVEAQRVDAEAVTATSQTLVINYESVKDYIVTNRAQIQSFNFMDDLRDKAAYSILHTINATLLSLISASTASPDHYIPFDSGSTLVEADVLEAKELLDVALVPEEGRFMLVGPYQLNDILAIAKTQDTNYNDGSKPYVTGKIPRSLHGFEVLYQSDLGNTVHCFHKSFMTMAIQKKMEAPKMYDLGGQGKRAIRLNTGVLWGATQMADDRVVTIY